MAVIKSGILDSKNKQKRGARQAESGDSFRNGMAGDYRVGVSAEEGQSGGCAG